MRVFIASVGFCLLFLGSFTSAVQAQCSPDTENPVISDMPDNISMSADVGGCGANVTWDPPTATDNCSLLSFVGTAAPGSYFGVGNTLVTYTAQDASGNLTAQSFLVSITDDEDPAFENVPSNIIQSAASGDCNATVAWTAPNATDNCGIASTTSTHDPNTSFGIGTTVVTYSTTDVNGRTADTTFTVTITDDETPGIVNLPANITDSVDTGVCGAVISWTAPTVDDNCTGASISQTAGLNSGQTFPVGTTTVEYTATDGAGNDSIASFTVTIADDQKPTLDDLPADISQGSDLDQCNAAVSWTAPSGGDNCPGWSVARTAGPASPATVAVGDTITIEYTATDVSGNTFADSFTITAYDNQNPTVAGLRGDTTIAATASTCGANFSWTAPTADDNCAGATVTQTAGAASGSNFAVGDHVITYVATDAAGNTGTASFTLTVEDSENPTISGMSNDTTLYVASGACTASLSWTTPTANDNCAGATIAQSQGSASGSNFALGGPHTIEYTATDAASNTHSESFTITVLDTISPSFPTFPSDQSVSNTASTCGAVVTWDVPGGGDNCSVASVVRTDGPDTGSTFPVGTDSITYQVTDGSGNVFSASFTVTVTDDEDPGIDGMPNDTTLYVAGGACDATLNWTEPTATDNCPGESIARTAGDAPNSTFAKGSHTVTYTATDAASNTYSDSFVITVVDTISPTIDGMANIPLNTATNSCTQIATWSEPGTNDNCGVATVTSDYDSGDAFGIGITTVTYTVTDSSNNSTSTSFQVIVTDNVAPVLTSAQDTTVNCDGAGNTSDINAWLANNGGATGTDNCTDAANLVWTNNYTGLSAGSCPTISSATVIFTAADSTGNTQTTSATLTITDTTAPTLSAMPGDTTVNCDAVPSAPTLTATDDCDASVSVSLTESQIPGTCPNQYSLTRTWSAADDCGNSVSYTQTVTVQDTVSPVITLATADSLVESTGGDQSAAFNAWLANYGGATVTDNCSANGDISWSDNYGTVGMSTGCAGDSVTVTFTATDECGNFSTTQATWRLIDTTPPTIDTAAQDSTAQCTGDTDALDAWLANNGGAAASDVAGNITWSNDYTTLSPAGTCNGETNVTVVFTATDDCGGTSSTTAEFTYEDNVAPVLSATPADSTVNCDAIPAVPTITALDSCTGPITVTFTETNTAGTCPNEYQLDRTWTAVDACSNSVSYTQVLTVQDTTAPNIITQAHTVYLDVNGNGSLTAADIDNGSSDNCTTSLTLTAAPTSFDCSAVGTPQTVSLSSTDECSNSNSADATVTVLDTISPSITSAALDTTINCDGAGNTDDINSWLANLGGAAATDNCVTVSWSHNYTGASLVAGTCPDIYTASVTFTASDGSTNTSSTTATLTIRDTAPPVLSATPSDTTMNCDADLTPPTLTATDACEGALTVNFAETRANGSCDHEYVLTRSWTAIDACGNAATHTQTVTVQDTTVPNIITQDTTVYLNASGSFSLSASHIDDGSSDNCTTSLTLTVSPTSFDCSTTGAQTATLTGTDDCGNTENATATVTVLDSISPGISGLPNDTTLYTGSASCTAVLSWTEPTSTDNCAGSSIAQTAGTTSGNTFSLGTNTVTYTSTDASANTYSESFVVTVVDTISPGIAGLIGDTIIYVPSTACTVAFSWTEPTATDNCTGQSIAQDGGSTNGNALGLGTTTVTYTATDGSLNTFSDSFNITVVDTIPPSLDLPANIVITADTMSCNAIATWATVTASDSCGTATITSESHTSGSLFAVGTTTVYYTATDDAGNTFSDSFTVTINDTDIDGDNIGDCSDPDIDGDGALNGADSDDFDPFVCSDTDGDGCEDCQSGTYDPANDGTDTDGDGICDGTDLCSDTLANNFDASLYINAECEPCPDAPVFESIDIESFATTLSSLDGDISLSISFGISGGSADTLFLFGQNGAADLTITLPSDLDNIPAGYYTAMVMDSDGCIGVAELSPGGTTLQQPGITRPLIVPYALCCSGCGVNDTDSDGICDDDDNCTDQTAPNYNDPANDPCAE